MRRKAKDESTQVWRECIARRAACCDFTSAKCLQCGPVEQALRAASWLECHWPRVQKST